MATMATLGDGSNGAASVSTTTTTEKELNPQQTPKTLESESPIEQQPDEEGGEDNEEGECGFCLFMKGGGCRDAFIDWEKCIEDAEKNNEDIVDKCFEVTGALKKCMEAHSEYYEPILRAEKMAEDELSKEKKKKEEEEDTKQIEADSTGN